MKSNFGSLALADWGRGLLIAVATAFFGALAAPLTTPPYHFPTPTEWMMIAVLSAGAGVSYILKQLGTNSQGQLLKKEPTAKVNLAPKAPNQTGG